MAKTRLSKVRVGIIGCGAIGSNLAIELEKQFSDKVKVAYLCDHHQERLSAMRKVLPKDVRHVSMAELVKKSEFIIEAASPETVQTLLALPDIQKKSLLVMSVGGLVRQPKKLASFFKKFKGQLHIPSGAIAGIDGLLASREAGIKSVILKTRKPPKGLDQAPLFKKKPFPVLKARQEVCLFKGSAAQAIRYFPQNVNVAAILSLAGLGIKKTRVEVWTSKAYLGNCHEIFIERGAGSIKIEVKNRPYPQNPKTSALAMYAALATMRQVFSPIQLGQ